MWHDVLAFGLWPAVSGAQAHNVLVVGAIDQQGRLSQHPARAWIDSVCAKEHIDGGDGLGHIRVLFSAASHDPDATWPALPFLLTLPFLPHRGVQPSDLDRDHHLVRG